MKQTIINITTLLTFGVLTSIAQNIGINGTGANPHPSALLDLDPNPTNNTGFLMPRLTTVQRLAIASPANGLQVFDTNLGDYYYYSTITNKWDCVTARAGTITHFGNITAPLGYLICDGSAVSRTIYPELFNAIGTLYGVGNGTTTFNLPDLRGEFIRGIDNGRGVDAGRALGSSQSFATNLPFPTGHDYWGFDPAGNQNNGPVHITTSDDYLNSSPALNDFNPPETRPRNIALLPCIKY